MKIRTVGVFVSYANSILRLPAKATLSCMVTNKRASPSLKIWKHSKLPIATRPSRLNNLVGRSIGLRWHDLNNFFVFCLLWPMYLHNFLWRSPSVALFGSTHCDTCTLSFSMSDSANKVKTKMIDLIFEH